jgi:aminoglycoside 2'-N-acetyltransferase I
LTEEKVEVVDSEQPNAGCRLALRTLWDRDFGDRFSDADADHAFGGVHVMAHDRDRLIGHANASLHGSGSGTSRGAPSAT